MELSDRLRAMRQRQALSQRDLAKVAGVHYTTVNKIETGRSKPNPRTVRKLAEALRTDVEELTLGRQRRRQEF